MTAPLASDMAVIRPAQPPYGEGLFLQLSLAQAEARRLRAHPLLHQLVPGAVFLGEGRQGEGGSDA